MQTPNLLLLTISQLLSITATSALQFNYSYQSHYQSSPHSSS